MSHFSRIKTSIREIDLLKKSLGNLNLNWEEKEQLIEGYQGETHRVNLVIRQKNNIDIAKPHNSIKFNITTVLTPFKISFLFTKFIFLLKSFKKVLSHPGRYPGSRTIGGS